MPLVTVLTPTYNRFNELNALFDSLMNQSNKDFEWLIVDDGSRDDTKSLIDIFREKSEFPIKYVYKKNGGKHTALNVGINMINTMLTFIVDSDDSLFPDAIQEIESYYEKYKNRDDIGAFSFLRCSSDNVNLVELPKEEFVDSYIDFRIKKRNPGDMAEVFYTNILKRFNFPVFDNERFLSEDVVWISIGLRYKYVFINKAIYQCEYLANGLTDNDKPLKFASPLGSMLRGKMLMKKECGLISNIRGAIIYNCYKKSLNRSIPKELLFHDLYSKILVFLTYPLGRIYYRKWRV